MQAGPAPCIGDLDEDDDVDTYRAVAALLAPARMPTALSTAGPSKKPEATAWLSALDQSSR